MFKCVPVCRRILKTLGNSGAKRRIGAMCLGAAIAVQGVAPSFAEQPALWNAPLRSSLPTVSGTIDADLQAVTRKILSVQTPELAAEADSEGTGGAPLLTGSIENPTATYADWFRFESGVERDWVIEQDGDDPWTVKIRPKVSLAPQNASSRPQVFVLYPRPSSAYDTSISQILQVFAEKGLAAEFTVKNFQRDPSLAQTALDYAKRHSSDLIFAMGSESTAWLWDNFRDGSIPVVSVCSKDPVMLGQAADYMRGSGTNFAFTSLNMPVEAQLAYIFELKPNLKNLAVLVDANNVSAVQTQAKPIAAAARKRGLRVVELEMTDRAAARDQLAVMVSGAVKAMRLNDPALDNSIFWVTGSTAVFREIDVINEHANRVPVLSLVPEVVKPGSDSAALSVGISFKSNALLAALYGSRVLAGRPVGKMKVGVVSPPDIAINFKRVRDIGLRMPFSFFEGASTVIDYEGNAVRLLGKKVDS